MSLVTYIAPSIIGFLVCQTSYASNFSLGDISESQGQNSSNSNSVENYDSENDEDLFGPIDSDVVPTENPPTNSNISIKENTTNGSLGLTNSSKGQRPVGAANSRMPKVNNTNSIAEPRATNQAVSSKSNGNMAIVPPLPPSSNPTKITVPMPTNADTGSIAPTAPTAAILDSAPLTSSAGIAPVRSGVQESTNSFSGVPTLPGTRRILPSGAAPDRYTIENGDTLYDICDQLIDDGNYWPKLWAINPAVKNPHFVYPGSELAFYPGDETEPPRLEIVDEDNMVPVDKGSISEAELVASNAAFNYLPKSSSNLSVSSQEPSEVVGPEGIVIDESIASIFQDYGKTYTGDSIVLQIPAVILKEEVSNLGTIKQGFHNQGMIGPGHSLVVESENSLSQGQVYSVLRESSLVYDPISGDEVGQRFEIVSSLKVDKPIGQGLYSAIAQEGRFGAKSGDILVPFRSTRRETAHLEVNGGLSSADATVVAMEMDDQKVTGLGGMVFVSKGQLAVGSHFAVYRKPLKSHSIFGNDNDDIKGQQIGAIRIIESNADTSVGVVVFAREELSIGDRLTE
jgi:hypothetical protein